MAKARYKADYKNKCTIKGTVLFGDLPNPPADYPDNIGVTLVVTPNQAAKFEAFVEGPVKAWLKETGKKKFQGLKPTPSVDKDGNEDGNFKINFKRKTEINGKLMSVPMFDTQKQEVDLEGNNLPRGSVVQVNFYLYLSANSQGAFGRAEPNAIRVLELGAFHADSTDWDDDEDEEETPDVGTASDFEDGDDEDDEEDMV